MADPGANPNLLRHSTAFISLSSIKSSARRIATSLSPVKQVEVFHSLEQDSPPRFSTDRSSASSISSPQSLHKYRTASSSTASLPYFPDRRVPSQSPITHHLSPSASFPAQSGHRGLPALDVVLPGASPLTSIPPVNRSSGAIAMISTPFANSFRPENGKQSDSSQSVPMLGQGVNATQLPGSGLSAGYTSAQLGGLQNPVGVYQYIHETSSKRISTLDYLRKAHEGRVYWFNTLLFSKSDLARMPYFEPRKMARRATNFLMLGLSLPTILDMNSSNALEYLRTLNALLLEFESFQQIHPPEGPSTSSLSRARIPQMFKRATHNTNSKGRRTSSATEIGLPMHTGDPAELKTLSAGGTGAGPSAASSFPVSEQDLLPGEEYTHLLTPSLPFDPDFFETFATLCDVLIDCYARILSLILSPAMCVPGVGEIFTKADTKLRKIIVTGIVRDFEDASRSGVKTEISGISKVVLGRLV